MNCLVPALEKITDDVMEIKDSFFGSAATRFCKYFFENLLHCAIVLFFFFLTLSTAKATIQTVCFCKEQGRATGILLLLWNLLWPCRNKGMLSAHPQNKSCAPLDLQPHEKSKGVFILSGPNMLKHTRNLKSNYVINIITTSWNHSEIIFCIFLLFLPTKTLKSVDLI